MLLDHITIPIKIYEAKGGTGPDKIEPKTPASAKTMYSLCLVALDSDSNMYIEYITKRSKSKRTLDKILSIFKHRYVYSWERIGSIEIKNSI